MVMQGNKMKVFIQEDDKLLQKRIAEDLKEYNYKLHFFSKDDSVFDLLKFNPDILIQDYYKNKVINCYQWAFPY